MLNQANFTAVIQIDQEAFRTAAEALRESQREKLANILTDEQLVQLDSLIDEKALEHFAEKLVRIGERDVSERVEGMTEKLGMDDEQTAALTVILESAVTSETAILQAAIDGDASVEETREALGDLRESTRAAVEAILTDEQIAALQEMGPPEGRPGRPGMAGRPGERGGRKPGPRGANL